MEFVSQNMGFAKYFDQIFSSAGIGYKKPQPEFFQAIWQKIGQPDKHSVFFTDDSEENISAAHAFGFQALLYPGFKHFITTLQSFTS